MIIYVSKCYFSYFQRQISTTAMSQCAPCSREDLAMYGAHDSVSSHI